MFGWTGQRVYI